MSEILVDEDGGKGVDEGHQKGFKSKERNLLLNESECMIQFAKELSFAVTEEEAAMATFRFERLFVILREGISVWEGVGWGGAGEDFLA